MTTHFIGAGPSAPDSLTLRECDLFTSRPTGLCAGPQVPQQISALTAREVIMAEMPRAYDGGQDAAGLHSGGFPVWSAMGGQMRRLCALDIPVSVTPGVRSFAATAAAARLPRHEYHCSPILEPDAPLASKSNGDDILLSGTSSCGGQIPGMFFHLVTGEERV